MSETLYTDIRAALTQHLADMPNLPEVAWEELPFKPKEGEVWLEPAVIWGEPTQAEYGTNGANHVLGIYQIACHYPAAEGVGDLNAMLGKLGQRFKRGTTLTYNGLTVKVRKSYPSAGNIMSIPFYCIAPN